MKFQLAFFYVQNRMALPLNSQWIVRSVSLMLLWTIYPKYEKFEIALLLVARGNIAVVIIGKAPGIGFACVRVFRGNRRDTRVIIE